MTFRHGRLERRSVTRRSWPNKPLRAPSVNVVFLQGQASFAVLQCNLPLLRAPAREKTVGKFTAPGSIASLGTNAICGSARFDVLILAPPFLCPALNRNFPAQRDPKTGGRSHSIVRCRGRPSRQLQHLNRASRRLPGRCAARPAPRRAYRRRRPPAFRPRSA